MIDSLCDQAREEELVVTWLYCDYNAQQEQTVINMMGAILKRLVGREIPEDIRKAFHEGRRPLLEDLIRMLRIAIASLPKVFICIDALDECLPMNVPEVLESLRDIVREFPSTRIFLTGRPHMGGDIHRYFPKAVVIPISPSQDDIRNYLEMRLGRDPEPEAMSSDLRADIVRVILEKISDMCVRPFRFFHSIYNTYLPTIRCRFLLVSLNIDAILGEVTIRQRRRKLQEMTFGNGLSNAYTATLTRVKAQKGYKSVLGLKVMMWVLHSERPLRAQELCHALGVEIGSVDLDPENVPALRTLLSSCLGLVTAEASSSTVRLVHFTLQEYLSSDPTLFPSPHSTIAEVCLTYLNFKHVSGLSPAFKSAPAITPFVLYASVYWGIHMRKEMTENTIMLALRLLDRFDEHISALLLLSYYGQDNDWCYNLYEAGRPTGFTGLHGAAFLGIAEIFSAVLEQKEWDFNEYDCMGMVALTWAAERGHEELVKILLQREDVYPNQADTKDGRTPLWWAACQGHEGVVKMLLARVDVNPDQADTRYGQTPLSWAAEKGHRRIVKILLEREDVNPDQADSSSGRTPLSLAAGGGHEEIVKMLLRQEGVNPDQADTGYRQTPLLWAAEAGHEGIVKMLLEQEDVNPSYADAQWDLTPLLRAAGRGHEKIVKILLERKDVNPDRADTHDGRTPLSCAAEGGYEGVVRMLLERGDVNPNQADPKYGQTPLSWAAEKGHEGVVRMLLEREDVYPNQADPKSGWTPLSWAAVNGHEGVVMMLLERNDIHTATPDNWYQTPLSLARSNGHARVVKMLEWHNSNFERIRL